MDRKRACLARAAACRERAEADAQNHDYWMKEAIRWFDVAQEPSGPAIVTFEAGGSRANPIKDDITGDDATPSLSRRYRRGRRPMGRSLKSAQSSIIQVTDAISPTNPMTAIAMK